METVLEDIIKLELNSITPADALIYLSDLHKKVKISKIEYSGNRFHLTQIIILL